MARCARLLLGALHYHKRHNELVCCASYLLKNKELNERDKKYKRKAKAYSIYCPVSTQTTLLSKQH